MSDVISIEAMLEAKGWRRKTNGTMEKILEEHSMEDKYARSYCETTTANVEVYEHEGKIYGAVYVDEFDPETEERKEKFEEKVVETAEDVEDIVAGL